MQIDQQVQFTRLIQEYSAGNALALNQIMPVIYDELKRISSRYLHEEYRQHTFQTTELVHEAYLRLVGNQQVTWESRAHFFGIAAQSMRQILVDHARMRKAQKRGSGKENISLDESRLIADEVDDRILALDDALEQLEFVDERSSRIVELRYFSGLTIEETAELMDISISTVKRDWNFAKAWLYREISNN